MKQIETSTGENELQDRNFLKRAEEDAEGAAKEEERRNTKIGLGIAMHRGQCSTVITSGVITAGSYCIVSALTADLSLGTNKQQVLVKLRQKRGALFWGTKTQKATQKWQRNGRHNGRAMARAMAAQWPRNGHKDGRAIV